VPELEVRERPPSMLRIVDGRPPRGVRDGGLEVGDVNGGPPWGCWRQVRQRPPPKLKKSMAGSLGGAAADPAAATFEVEDVDGGPPGGAGGKIREKPSGQFLGLIVMSH
jgi:hypothetical protein